MNVRGRNIFANPVKNNEGVNEMWTEYRIVDCERRWYVGICGILVRVPKIVVSFLNGGILK